MVKCHHPGQTGTESLVAGTVVGVSVGEALTDETEARLWQVRPFKDGVEDVLSFTVQLIHLVQNKKPEEDRQTQLLLIFRI